MLQNRIISVSEAYVLSLLRDEGMLSVKEISERMGRDRSTAQNIVYSLVGNGYVKRKQVNLPKGYKFVYYLNI